MLIYLHQVRCDLHVMIRALGAAADEVVDAELPADLVRPFLRALAPHSLIGGR